jgi:hypothetical protein
MLDLLGIAVLHNCRRSPRSESEAFAVPVGAWLRLLSKSQRSSSPRKP